MGLFDNLVAGGGNGLRSKKNGAKLSRMDGRTAVKTYFELWNERRMDEAIDLFADECTYEDTLYPSIFQGKDQLQSHLINVANSLPSSFRFVVDAISEDLVSGYVGVQWHVESNNQPLPFTRGSSMYRIDQTTGKIVSGFDVPEPVVKNGGISLFILKQASTFIDDRTKLIPFLGWIFYCWFLFLSDVAPGPNALSLDPNTWNEVLALSWNFWLVLPLAFPQWDIDSLSPVLEGIFNFLLAWSGLFFGFIVDGKKDGSTDGSTGGKGWVNVKGEIGGSGEGGERTGTEVSTKNAFLPVAVVMQFLTNAAYLPYLVTRRPLALVSTTRPPTAISTTRPPTTVSTTAPPAQVIYAEDLTPLEAIFESKLVPIFFGSVGMLSVYWILFGRIDQGYVDMNSRWASFQAMMSSDRLSFSFLVDLIYFGVFQSWLMGDDLARRGLSEGASEGVREGVRDDMGGDLREATGTLAEGDLSEQRRRRLLLVGKIPFVGLVLYLLGRPSLPRRSASNGASTSIGTTSK